VDDVADTLVRWTGKPPTRPCPFSIARLPIRSMQQRAVRSDPSFTNAPSTKEEGMLRPTDRTALITGASRGLGLALARGLATRGWNLIIAARDAERLRVVRDELAPLTHVAALAGDISNAAHRATLAIIARGHTGVDALVNNAGLLGPSPQPGLLDYPLDVFEDVLRVNVLGPLGMIQALRSDLKHGARIVNVTSDAAVVPYGGWGAYGASKAAVEQFSAILAAENPELRVYWVDPGDMRTDMQQAAFPGEDISDRPLPEARVPGFVTLLEGDLPSGRYRVEELTQSKVIAA
jgi:NAD(P)-dependent dehydrogenase (short-subunit alcohol dehydrogenase family)